MRIKVTADIPFGNACGVSVADSPGGPVVSFEPHPHGGPECLWFCFRVICSKGRARGRTGGVAGGKSLRLVWTNLQNALGGLPPEKLRPVIRADDGDWERLPPGTGEVLPDGRCNAIWTIPVPGKHADVAFCYPYGAPELEALLRETGGYWKADRIGSSQAGRPLLRLSNSPGEKGSGRPGLYLVARQHSGETPGSWVLDGFLRRVAERGDRAPLVWAVPLANIDGVEGGDYGKDNFPYDLNRAWGNPPMRHETLVYQRDMKRWKERCRPILCVDFHAPGGSENDGAYLYLPRPDGFPDAHRAASEWASAIAAGLTREYASEKFARVADYASRWETPTLTAFCASVLKIPAFTIETPYGSVGDRQLTREDYRAIGSRMADVAIERAWRTRLE
ncbi:MAG: M14 family zinc carboxypeptidase [Planctomycetota bacterium]|nr:M14 family zinc carboxypeptidase [Planctomycetota bacterium]